MSWTRDERLRYIRQRLGALLGPQDTITYTIVSVIGTNATLGTTLESIWYNSTLMNYPPDTGATVEWISSAAGDDGSPLGAGMGTARAEYLDRRLIKRGVSNVLNGIAAVASGISDLRRVIRTYGIEPWGTSGVAAGAVDLRDSGTATIYERIFANQRSSASARYTVPRVLDADGVRVHDTRAFIFDWYADSASTQGGVVGLCHSADFTGITGNPVTMPMVQVQSRVTAYKTGDAKLELVDPLELAVGTDVEIRGASMAGTIQCAAGFEVWEIVLPDFVTI